MANKRGNHDGSIYQRKDGRWAAAISLGQRGGARQRKTFYGNTRRAVQERLTEAMRAHDLGINPPGETQSVGRYLERWLEESVKSTVRPRTYVSYSQLVRLHITPELGHIRLARLTPQDVQGFMNRKLESGLSPRTVQYLHAVLRQALNRAMRWDVVPRNVATLVDPPRQRRAEVPAMSPTQARTLLNAMRGDRLEALYSVALAIGLRQGEALGLHWEDVDLKTGTIRVRAALQRVDGRLVIVEPKSASSRRSVATPRFVVAILRAHRARQLEERLIAGPLWQETGLVFTASHGTPLDARNVLRQFKKSLEKAGLPSMRFHDLRHGCASLLLAQGVHPRVVMETLGHSQIALTMNTYSHVIPALQREAADQMEEALAGP